jgi:hypothetical protein
MIRSRFQFDQIYSLLRFSSSHTGRQSHRSRAITKLAVLILFAICHYRRELKASLLSDSRLIFHLSLGRSRPLRPDLRSMPQAMFTWPTSAPITA